MGNKETRTRKFKWTLKNIYVTQKKAVRENTGTKYVRHIENTVKWKHNFNQYCMKCKWIKDSNQKKETDRMDFFLMIWYTAYKRNKMNSKTQIYGNKKDRKKHHVCNIQKRGGIAILRSDFFKWRQKKDILWY